MKELIPGVDLFSDAFRADCDTVIAALFWTANEMIRAGFFLRVSISVFYQGTFHYFFPERGSKHLEAGTKAFATQREGGAKITDNLRGGII